MHSKVAMQCGPATGGTSHNVWDVVLYNPKGRAFSSRISWAVSIYACQHAVFPDDWCYSPIWCWSQRLARSSLSLVSNATLAIEQPSQGTLGNAIPTFNPDFGRQVWHRSTSASSLWSTQQKALLRRLPVRLSSELETTRSENIFQKKSIQRRGYAFDWELVAWDFWGGPDARKPHCTHACWKDITMEALVPLGKSKASNRCNSTWLTWHVLQHNRNAQQIAKLKWCYATLSSQCKTVQYCPSP